jgi:hypothetical protein
MHRQPHNRAQAPAGESETIRGNSVAAGALVTMTLLIGCAVMLTTCQRLLAPPTSFSDRWPREEFHPFIHHQGHLPRSPLTPWWIERVIV